MCGAWISHLLLLFGFRALTYLLLKGLIDAPSAHLSPHTPCGPVAWTQSTKPFDRVDLTNAKKTLSAAAVAASEGHAHCFRYLAEIGGAAAFLEQLRGRESLIDSKFRWLLAEPALLNLGPRLSPPSPAPVPAPDAPAPVPARNPPAPSPPAPDESAGAMPVSLVDAICIVLLAYAIALCLYSLHIALLLYICFSSATSSSRRCGFISLFFSIFFSSATSSSRRCEPPLFPHGRVQPLSFRYRSYYTCAYPASAYPSVLPSEPRVCVVAKKM